MERGVDLAMFNPAHRTRGNDGQFVIGYVGRLSTEKKVRSFAGLAKAVKPPATITSSSSSWDTAPRKEWLSKNIPNVEMTGVLRGEPLSRAYANMDLFAFYSETDTFGNVVLEALASGVPAVVTDKGGPKFIVDHERCGFVCSGEEEFNASVLRLIASPSLQSDMAVAARQRAQRASWDAVFDSVYDAYRRHLAKPGGSRSSARFHAKLDSSAPRIASPAGAKAGLRRRKCKTKSPTFAQRQIWVLLTFLSRLLLFSPRRAALATISPWRS